jgi:hypothetical protein
MIVKRLVTELTIELKTVGHLPRIILSVQYHLNKARKNDRPVEFGAISSEDNLIRNSEWYKTKQSTPEVEDAPYPRWWEDQSTSKGEDDPPASANVESTNAMMPGLSEKAMGKRKAVEVGPSDVPEVIEVRSAETGTLSGMKRKEREYDSYAQLADERGVKKAMIISNGRRKDKKACPRCLERGAACRYYPGKACMACYFSKQKCPLFIPTPKPTPPPMGEVDEDYEDPDHGEIADFHLPKPMKPRAPRPLACMSATKRPPIEKKSRKPREPKSPIAPSRRSARVEGRANTSAPEKQRASVIVKTEEGKIFVIVIIRLLLMKYKIR